MLKPLYLTAFVSLGLSVCSLALILHVILSPSHESNTVRLEVLENGVAVAEGCRQEIVATNESYLECIDRGNSECSQLTDSVLLTQSRLDNMTVESLEAKLTAIQEECHSRTQALRSAIAMVMPADNYPTVTGNGTVSVQVEGALSFPANYEILQFSVGGFELDYLVLLPWDGPVATAIPSPTIAYDGIVGLASSVGETPLHVKQQEAFMGGNVRSYYINATQLIFQGFGSGTFQLTRRFMVF